MSERLKEYRTKDGKRCVEGLGPCSVKRCPEITCCKRLCNSYYSGANPFGYCEKYGGYPGRICLCEHDC